MATGPERRMSERVPCDDPLVIATYGLVSPEVTRCGLPARRVCVSADERGIGLETQHPLFTGERVRVEGGAVVREAVIRWVAAAASGYRAGAAFVV